MTKTREDSSAFDMAFVERHHENSENLERQADLYMEASMMLLASAGRENSLKSLAAEMFDGREWSWSDA